VHLHAAALPRLPHTPFLRDAWLYFARNGSYGVTVFFVVSGFVITRTVLRRNPDLRQLDRRAFYVRRAARILPLLLVVLAIGSLALALVPADARGSAFCLRDPHARFDAGALLSVLTFSFNWLRIARESVSYGFGLHWDVLWSLSIEEQFYLGYPLLIRGLGERRRLTAALLLFVVLGPISRHVAGLVRPGSFLLAFTSSFPAFEQIAEGALLALVLERVGDAAGARWWRRVEPAVGAFALLGAAFVYRITSLDQAVDRVWGPSALALCAATAMAVGIRRRWFEGRALSRLARLGEYSYGSYLLHATVLFTLWPLLAGRHPAVAFAAFATATLALAGAVYRYVEVPANAAVRRLLSAS
jgi:peptidoglycan/LPS O-acetylase OafA/YrhL